MSTAADVSFREVQKFRGPWTMLAILVAVALPAGLMVYGLVQQIALDRPFGDNATSDTGLIIISALVFLLCGSIGLLLWSAQLVTEVRRDGVYYRYRPFFRSFHSMKFDEITIVEERTYSPLRDYGGWGIRTSWRGQGMAYNVSGNRGVWFKTRDGRARLIGSKLPEEFAEAVRRGIGAPAKGGEPARSLAARR